MAATLSLKIIQEDERRVAAIMTILNSFTGVRVAEMQTLHVSRAFAAAAHPAAAAAIAPRKPRTATAIGASVRGIL